MWLPPDRETHPRCGCHDALVNATTTQPPRSGRAAGGFDVISADGTRVRAWRNGGDERGLPVVISNGLGTPPESWPRLVDEPQTFHAVSWYYRGTGGGERPAEPSHVSIDDHVDDLIAVMDAEGIERALLACWSLGVNVGFEAALRYPERVAGVLAVAGVPGGTFRAMGGLLRVPRRLRHPLGVFGTHLLRRAAPGIGLLVKAVPMNRSTAWLVAHSGFVLPAAKPEVLLPALRVFSGHDWRWYFTLALGAVDHAPLDLSGLRVPATLLAGRWDVLTWMGDMQAAAATIPDCELAVLPGSHFLPLEYPDEITDALLELADRAGL